MVEADCPTNYPLNKDLCCCQSALANATTNCCLSDDPSFDPIICGTPIKTSIQLVGCYWHMVSVTDSSFPDIDYGNGATPKPDDVFPCLDQYMVPYEVIKVSLGSSSPSLQQAWSMYQTPYTINGKRIYWIQSPLRATQCPLNSWLAWDDADCQKSWN